MSSEASEQQKIRLEASRLDIVLLRNNSGAAFDKDGRLIRYGLGNDSARINKGYKSSDLIGITPVMITAEMIGQVVGIFTAIECKRSDWIGSTLSERETAQKNFIDHVLQYGGYAGFARNVDDFKRIVKR